ncbi:MAG: hypothetical protein ACYDFT_05115 [Thermoplasmata archaeon]
MTGAPPRPGSPLRESDLAPPVAAFLGRAGYEVLVDPDGTGYFDVAARRGSEIGLVELKLEDWRTLLRQAVARRGYADWVAVALPRRSTAERLAARAAAAPARSIGVYHVAGDSVEVLRPPVPWPEATRRLFGEQRASLRALFEGARAGLPEGTRWTGFPSRSGRYRGARATTEWRLEEFAPAPLDG